MTAHSSGVSPPTIRKTALTMPPMGDAYGGTVDRLQPARHPLGQRRIGFCPNSGRQEVPLVARTPGAGAWLAEFQFGIGEALPVAEMDLLQAVVSAIAVRVEAHGGADALHGLAGPAQGTGDEIERGGVADDGRQMFAVRRRLERLTSASMSVSACPCSRRSTFQSVWPWRTR